MELSLGGRLLDSSGVDNDLSVPNLEVGVSFVLDFREALIGKTANGMMSDGWGSQGYGI